MTQVWINGQQDATLDPMERAFAYGDGVFATMAVDSHGQLRFAECYWQRLQDGCARLGFAWQPSDSLLALVHDLAAKHPLHCLKLQLSRGVGGRGYAPPTSVQITEVVSVSPLPAHYRQWQAQGISLATSEVKLARQPLLAGFKHCNRLEQVLIKQHALPQGYDDWLVLDTAQNVVESSVANLVLLVEQQQQLKALVPSHAYAGVAGVMRQQLLLALLADGISIEMRDITMADLLQAKHFLLCNSLFGTVDVCRVDNHPFARWQGTARLQQLLVPH